MTFFNHLMPGFQCNLACDPTHSLPEPPSDKRSFGGGWDMRSGIRWMKLSTAPQNVAAGLGKAETVRLWIQIRNSRPHGSKQPPAARGSMPAFCVLNTPSAVICSMSAGVSGGQSQQPPPGSRPGPKWQRRCVMALGRNFRPDLRNAHDLIREDHHASLTRGGADREDEARAKKERIPMRGGLEPETLTGWKRPFRWRAGMRETARKAKFMLERRTVS
jgi:hypothetical protein